jgi:hypothetical protein
MQGTVSQSYLQYPQAQPAFVQPAYQLMSPSSRDINALKSAAIPHWSVPQYPQHSPYTTIAASPQYYDPAFAFPMAQQVSRITANASTNKSTEASEFAGAQVRHDSASSATSLPVIDPAVTALLQFNAHKPHPALQHPAQPFPVRPNTQFAKIAADKPAHNDSQLCDELAQESPQYEDDEEDEDNADDAEEADDETRDPSYAGPRLGASFRGRKASTTQPKRKLPLLPRLLGFFFTKPLYCPFS